MTSRFVALLMCLGTLTFLTINPNKLDASGCRPVAVSRVVTTREIVAVRQDIVPVAVPLAFPVIAVPVYSYINAAPVSSYYQPNQASVDQIVDLVMKKMEAKWGVGGGPPAINRTGTAPVRDNNAVTILLTNNCASCHSGQATTGGSFSFFDENKHLKALSRETKWDMFDQVYDGRMPKGKSPLSDADVDLIRQWARQK